jgi:hypothetical protein
VKPITTLKRSAPTGRQDTSTRQHQTIAARVVYAFATTAADSVDAAAPRMTRAEMDQLRQVQKGVWQQTEFRGET